MSITILSRQSRRFLSDRLDRLNEAMANLASRLRASIAHIIGTHVGEAIRDVLARVLHTRFVDLLPNRRQHEWPLDQEEGLEPEGYRHDDEEQGFWDARERPPPKPLPEHRPQASREEHRPSRRKSLLSGLVQIASCWLHHGEKRPSLLKLACVATVVSAATLLSGPLVGAVAMTIGIAVAL